MRQCHDSCRRLQAVGQIYVTYCTVYSALRNFVHQYCSVLYISYHVYIYILVQKLCLEPPHALQPVLYSVPGTVHRELYTVYTVHRVLYILYRVYCFRPTRTFATLKIFQICQLVMKEETNFLTVLFKKSEKSMCHVSCVMWPFMANDLAPLSLYVHYSIYYQSAVRMLCGYVDLRVF